MKNEKTEKNKTNKKTTRQKEKFKERAKNNRRSWIHYFMIKF